MAGSEGSVVGLWKAPERGGNGTGLAAAAGAQAGPGSALRGARPLGRPWGGGVTGRSLRRAPAEPLRCLAGGGAVEGRPRAWALPRAGALREQERTPFCPART